MTPEFGTWAVSAIEQFRDETMAGAGSMGTAVGCAIVNVMATTTMQLSGDIRDQLTKIGERDFNGVSLGETVRRLVKEHEIHRIMLRYEELRADPEEWASYQAELAEWDQTVTDGLPDASEESWGSVQ